MSADSPASGPLLRRAPEILALVALAALALRSPTTWAEGALLVDLPLGLALLVAGIDGRLSAPRGPLLGLAAILLAASAATAPDTGSAVTAALHSARLVAGFWLGCTLSAREGAASRAAAALAGAGALGALHAALQVVVLHPRIAAEHPELAPGALAQLLDRRANSVFLLPAHFGAFEAAACVASAGLALGERGGRRAAAVAATLLALGGIALSGSFGALLLGAAGMGSLVLVSVPPRLRLALLGAVGLGALVLAGVALDRRHDEVNRETPWSARAVNWHTAAKLIREAPLLGHGPGSFGVEHARARPAASNDVQHAHEAFLEAASDGGIGMLALLAAFVASLAARCARVVRRSEAGIAAGLVAASGVAVAAGLVDFGWSLPEWAIPAAALLGVAWGLAPVAVERPSRASLGAAALAWAALLLGDGAAAVAGLARERALADASRGDHASAHRLLERATRAQPLDDRAWAELAASDLALAAAEADPAARARRLVDAEREARRAIRCSPRKAAGHALLARVLAASGDRIGSEAAAARALGLAPHAAPGAAP